MLCAIWNYLQVGQCVAAGGALKMLKWFQGSSGKVNAEKTQSRRVRAISFILQDHLCDVVLVLQVDNHYQALSNDQLYNPFTEVLVLTGGCVSSIHQIDLIEDNK